MKEPGMFAWGRTVGAMRFAAALLALPLLLSACSDGSETSNEDAAPLPSVVVEAVTAQDVADQADFVGRTEASQRVDIRARVSGTLLERPFEEGKEIEKGALLYKIDPAEFQARVMAAEAQLTKAQASQEENERNRKRYETLLERESASQAQYDIAKSQAEQSTADVEAAKADLERARLDLGYATIVSPIAGRSGISSVDVGNLIGPDSGVLVTVLDLDPIDVIFSIGERDYLNFKEADRAGDAPPIKPQIRLANNQLYGHDGKVDLIDNKVDPATGTIAVRLQFPNPDRLLVPGQYVSVLLSRATPEERIVIPQVAVQENQAGPFVLIVNGEGRIESRPVKTGDRIEDGIVVLEGLAEGETLVVEGIQKVRPGAEVETDFRDPEETPEIVDEEAGPEAEAGEPDPTPGTEPDAGPQSGP